MTLIKLMFYLAYGQRMAAHTLSIASLGFALLSTHSYMYGEQLLFWGVVKNPLTLVFSWLAVLIFPLFMISAAYQQRIVRSMGQQLLAREINNPPEQKPEVNHGRA